MKVIQVISGHFSSVQLSIRIRKSWTQRRCKNNSGVSRDPRVRCSNMLRRNPVFLESEEQRPSSPLSPPCEPSSSSSHHGAAALWLGLGPLWVLASLSPVARSAESSETDWQEQQNITAEVSSALIRFPVNYGGLAHPNLDTLSSFFLAGLLEDMRSQPNCLDCPHKVSLEIWWCLMCMCKYEKTVLLVGKPVYFYCNAIIYFY